MESENVIDYSEVMPAFNGILIVDDDATIKDVHRIMLALNGMYVPWSMSKIMPGRKVVFYVHVGFEDEKAEMKVLEKCTYIAYEDYGRSER